MPPASRMWELEVVGAGLPRTGTLSLRAALELLLEAGTDPTARGVGGLTALHYAAHRGLVGVLAQMVERGAQVDAQDENGWTPVHWASRGGEEGVRILVSLGADLTLVTNLGRSPLHRAAFNNQPGTAAALVELGCPLHLVSSHTVTLLQVDNEGKTALEVATEEESNAVVAVLSQ